MNKQELNKIKKYFTIEKQEFSYFSQKMVNKKYRLYTRDFLPPMYKDVLGLDRGWKIHTIENMVYFKQKNRSYEIKKRFSENIDLQIKILSILKARWIKFNYKCGIIKAKTGVGKTHIVMDIIEYLQLSTLILVSNKKLMQEMIDKFDKMSNIKPSQYGDGQKNIGNITIMTKTSFNLCEQEDIKHFSLVIVDECHQGFTKKFRDKMNTTFHNKDIFLYGLSATPSTDELTEKDINKYYGKTIEIQTEYDFIPEFTFYNYQHLKEYEFEHYAELRGMMSEDRDRFNHQFTTISNKLSNCSLILCDRISEIELYYEIFMNEDMGFDISYREIYNIIKITGKTKIKDDKFLLEESLKNGKPTIIIGSIKKCSVGFDHPPIDIVFIFSAIKFENTVIQSIGRGLRKHPGKTGCKVYVWNDSVLPKQRTQKMKAIESEYGVSKLQITQININKKRKKKGIIALEF